MRISLKHTFPALLTFIQFFQNTHDVLTDAFGISSKVGSPLARRSFLNNAQEGIENADEMELGVVGQRGNIKKRYLHQFSKSCYPDRQILLVRYSPKQKF